MLKSLSVNNFILIDKLELDFENSLCIITGETGAGKSILLDAILFCLGKKYDNIVKTGTSTATVIAIFSANTNINNLIAQNQIDVSDEIILKSVQTNTGRRKFYINDQLIAQKTLENIASCLLEIHGQNSHSILLSPSAHLQILDEYGDLISKKRELGEIYKQNENYRKQIDQIKLAKEGLEREIDYLIYAVDELKKSNVEAGEEERLSTERRQLQNKDKEVNFLAELISLLSQPEVEQTINKMLKSISRSNIEEKYLSAAYDHISRSYDSLSEAKELLSQAFAELQNSTNSLSAVQERLFDIKALARKYASSCDDLPALLIKYSEKLNSIRSQISSEQTLESTLVKSLAIYQSEANNLSLKRKIAADDLVINVQKQLSSLQMPRAIFAVSIEAKPASHNGIDNISFTVSTNPGTVLASIDKIASGGELSRFMLALRVALFDKSIKPLIIFDEIDVGIGGSTAEAVGDHLKALSKVCQLIVITHQPQVACKAHQHILVSKQQLADETRVKVVSLSDEERAIELARMISGRTISDKAISAAKELINKS